MTAAAVTVTTGRKLDLGRVFSDTFGVIRRQAAPLLGVTFVLYYLPSLLNGYISTSVLRIPVSEPTARLTAFGNPLYGTMSLVTFVLGAYVLACQNDIAISDLEGRDQPLSEALRRALGKILPLIGVMILFFLGVGLGTVLFIVPGIILAVMWIVALPAAVADTSNPVKALGRSRALTKGNRWRIFGLVLLFWLIAGVVEAIVVGGASALGAFPTRLGVGLPGLVVVYLVSFAFSLCMSVGGAALYVQLRELKGGGESVAQVFA